MISKEKKEYNEWYFNVIAKSAINRISEHCKKVDKNFNFNGTEEDFIPLLKYLKEFEKTNALDESLKRDLWTIRNFHDYEKLMEAA